MCLLQHNLKCSGSVASPEVKGETDFLLVVFPSPLFFFFFYSLFLLSQLPNISFDVLCWDFKRTLSTWAGVGFSEQARVPHSSRGASGSRTFLPGLSWSSAGRAHSHSRSRSPDAASPRALGLWSAPRLRGVVRVHQDFLPSFKSLSKGICLPSERLRRGCLTAAY